MTWYDDGSWEDDDEPSNGQPSSKTTAFIGIPDADRDAWTTPPWITEAIGPVWLDPCSNKYSTVRAERTFQLDRGEDGLKLAKYVPRNPPGLVWINPPYSDGMVLQFVRAYGHTRFAFLLRHDVSTKWFRELYAITNLIAQPWQRINFVPPPGLLVKSHNNPYPHSIFYRDPGDATDAIRRICAIVRPERLTPNA